MCTSSNLSNLLRDWHTTGYPRHFNFNLSKMYNSSNLPVNAPPEFALVEHVNTPGQSVHPARVPIGETKKYILFCWTKRTHLFIFIFFFYFRFPIFSPTCIFFRLNIRLNFQILNFLFSIEFEDRTHTATHGARWRNEWVRALTRLKRYRHSRW